MPNSFAGRILSSNKLVSSAGTSEQISTKKVRFIWLRLRAKGGNQGAVYWGNAGDDNIETSEGEELWPGEFAFIEVKDGSVALNTIYLDADNTNDGVSWVILKPQIGQATEA